ncbi:hypothetical protein D3C72_595950 [compost metagenome]
MPVQHGRRRAEDGGHPFAQADVELGVGLAAVGVPVGQLAAAIQPARVEVGLFLAERRAQEVGVLHVGQVHAAEERHAEAVHAARVDLDQLELAGAAVLAELDAGHAVVARLLDEAAAVVERVVAPDQIAQRRRAEVGGELAQLVAGDGAEHVVVGVGVKVHVHERADGALEQLLHADGDAQRAGAQEVRLERLERVGAHALAAEGAREQLDGLGFRPVAEREAAHEGLEQGRHGQLVPHGLELVGGLGVERHRQRQAGPLGGAEHRALVHAHGQGLVVHEREADVGGQLVAEAMDHVDVDVFHQVEHRAAGQLRGEFFQRADERMRVLGEARAELRHHVPALHMRMRRRVERHDRHPAPSQALDHGVARHRVGRVHQGHGPVAGFLDQVGQTAHRAPPFSSCLCPP